MILVWYAFWGLALGFSLSSIGFTDYDELHRMFTLFDARLFLTFAGAVVLCAACYLPLRKRYRMTRLRITKGTVPGGILFGLGWVLCGACPAVSLVQLGEGRLAALFTIAGVAVGILLYPLMHARYFRFDPGSCSE